MITGKHVIFSITGLTCVSSASVICANISKLTGVIDASVDFASERLYVIFDDNKINEEDIITCVRKIGYGAASAVVVWPVLPKLPLVSSPNQLREVNAELQKEKDKLLFSQRELQKAYDEMEQRVIERTLQLENANKELEAFSYSVSHDLRAPLRHISGFIGLLLKNKTSQFTEEELGYLDVVTNSVGEMGKLIDALLTFSRLNRTGLQKDRIDTVQIIQQGLKLFEAEIKSRGIEVKIEPVPEINGDYQLMGQVWINLISNAIKYTGKREKAIIEIGSYVEDSETVFYIKDNGAGFNMKYADKLFGVFQRLHKPRDFEGVGIGLANINRIITRHGGRCWAEGEIEQGATFYFSIPHQ